MGRAPCCSKVGLHRGPWTPREDTLLINYIKAHGEGHWRSLPKKAGLLRCGKSCRLRWMNYLRPDIKRGNITPEEDDLILRLHALLGNRWSLIAGRLPGRTDNEIKNYWNTHLRKRLVSNHKVPFSSSPSSSGRNSKLDNDNKNNNNNNRNGKRRSSYNKKQHKKNSPAVSEITRPKVHLPKAIRVTSSFLSPSLKRNEKRLEFKEGGGRGSGGAASSQSLGVWGNNTEEVLPWEILSEFERQENRGDIEIARRYECDEPEVGFINANCTLSCSLSDFEIPRAAAMEANNNDDDDHNTNNNNNSLDQLYEEYLQLLGTTDHDHQMELDDPLLHSADSLAQSSSGLNCNS